MWIKTSGSEVSLDADFLFYSILFILVKWEKSLTSKHIFSIILIGTFRNPNIK